MSASHQIKFSFIIPFFNVQQYLSDCLESIKRQTVNDYEIICVDDGSTDNSLAIAEDFKRNNPDIDITVISKENAGPSAARNVGMSYAKGQYIWFIDSDDYISPLALEVLSKEISDKPDIVMFDCQKVCSDSNEILTNNIKKETYDSGWEYFESLAKNDYNCSFVAIWCRIVKREILANNRIEFLVGAVHQDVLFTPIECYYSKYVKVIDDVLYFYRIRSKSIMHTPGIHHYESYAHVANELSRFFIPARDINKSVIYKYISSYFRRIFIEGNKSMDKHLMSEIDKKSFFITSTASIKSMIACLLILMNPKISRVIFHSTHNQ